MVMAVLRPAAAHGSECGPYASRPPTVLRRLAAGLQRGQELLAVDPQQCAFRAGAHRGGAGDAVQQTEFPDIAGRGHRRQLAGLATPGRSAHRQLAPARIHSASGSSPSRITTLPAGRTTSSAAPPAVPGWSRSAPASRSSSDSSATRGRRRAATAAEVRSARSRVGRPTSAIDRDPDAHRDQRDVDVGVREQDAGGQTGQQDAAQHQGVEDAEHAAEHVPGQVALQAGDGQHVHDDHADAGGHLQDAGQRGESYRDGHQERQRLQADAAHDDRGQPGCAAQPVRQPGADHPAERCPASR